MRLPNRNSVDARAMPTLPLCISALAAGSALTAASESWRRDTQSMLRVVNGLLMANAMRKQMGSTMTCYPFACKVLRTESD
jgi:hypothetical protein